MEYYNLIFAVFYLWRLAITTLDKQSCLGCFCIIIFAVFLPNDKSKYNFNPNELFYPTIIGLSGKRYNLLEIKRLNCLTSNFLDFDFNLWPSEVTLGCDSKAHVTSYVSFIDTFSPSLTVFEIFAFKVCRFRPWPFSLYSTVVEIFVFKVLRFWSLTFDL